MVFICPTCNTRRDFTSKANILTCTACAEEFVLVPVKVLSEMKDRIILLENHKTDQAQGEVDARTDDQKLVDAASYAEMEKRNAQQAAAGGAPETKDEPIPMPPPNPECPEAVAENQSGDTAESPVPRTE